MTTKKAINAKCTNEVLQSLVQVKLTVHFWNGVRKQNDLAREFEVSKGAEDDSCDLQVIYIPKHIQHKIGVAKSRLESFWKTASLPWEDGGWRVVTAEAFMPLLDSIAPLVRNYNDTVEEVVGMYDEIKAEAKRKLNGMFDESRFPSKDDFRAKYGVDNYSKPIPISADTRIAGLSEASQQLVRRSVEMQISEQLNKAVETIGERLKKLVNDMQIRLAKDDAKGTRFAGLLGTVNEVCDALATLNITKDPVVTETINKVKRTLTKYSPDDLRDETKPTVRNDMKLAARTLAAELDELFK